MTQLSQTPHSEYFFDFGDVGEQHWIMWHHLRHRAYDQIAAKAGTQFSTLDLTGKVDRDWLKRHADRHDLLKKLTGAAAHSFVALVDVDWESESQVNDWLRIHALDHTNLDAYFGLV
jgi:hypothetical protein